MKLGKYSILELIYVSREYASLCQFLEKFQKQKKA